MTALSGDFLAFDLMVRGGSIALLALWSWLLIRDHWSALPARIAVMMNASIACHVIATTGWSNEYPGLDWVFELGSVSVPAFFWLFARAWFNDEERIGWRSWLVVPLCMIVVTIVDLNFEAKTPFFFAMAAIMRGTMFALGAAGLWVAWRGREGDLVESRRRLRLLMIVTVGAFVIVTNAIEILAHNAFIPNVSRSFIEVGILVLTFGFCAYMFGIRQGDLFGSVLRREAERQVPAGLDPLAIRLLAHMESEKSHRDETLTIAGLAQQLGEQEYRLRRLINGSLGHRNFAAFLNGYRLDEVKAALADPAQKNVPILTMALDAGFGSLGPFNRAFRETVGMTPTEFRARS
jgi:AraC-like DNA-binding protein